MREREIQVCIDCRNMHCNGEADPDRDWDELCANMERTLGAGNLCLGDSEKDYGFSIEACEGCGDRRHGDRYHMVGLYPDATEPAPEGWRGADTSHD